MTTNKFLLLLLLFPLTVAAQPDSSRFNIRLNGGYADIASSNGVSSLGAVSSNSRQWEVSLSAGYIIDKHWEIGLGFSYQKQKTRAQSTVNIPIDPYWLGQEYAGTGTYWLGVEQTEANVHLTTFDIYTAGYWRLFNRFYFTPKLTFRIGGAKGTQESVLATATEYQINDFYVLLPASPRPQLTSRESNISYDYAALQLAPAFTFYINRHFALNLETGSFHFSAIDWEWDNKQWLANVNPAYWRLGIVVAF
ncbi:MAG: outer membrane beta-barrel protein [Tannerella sp.]|jgi:hypothetical protein|nr:outer membrane beta-barrel protein [Tannerella sp.]